MGMVRVFDGEKKTWTEYPMKEGFERNDLFMAQTAHFCGDGAGWDAVGMYVAGRNPSTGIGLGGVMVCGA